MEHRRGDARIHMTSLFKRFGTLLVAAGLMQGYLEAQIPDGPYTREIPTTTTPWGPLPVNLPQFNPGLGTLLGVEIEIVGGAQGLGTVFNNALSFISGSLEVTSTISVSAPALGGEGQVVLSPTDSQSVLVFGGANQSVSLAASQSTFLTFVEGVNDLSPFIGSGEVEITASAAGLMRFRSSGNTTINATTSASASASIVYLYEPPTSFEASLNGYLWCDADMDGNIGPEEFGLGGWTVELIDMEFDEVVQTTESAPDGEYIFVGVTAGREYRINVIPNENFPPISDPDGLLIFDGVNFVDSANTAVVFLEQDFNGPFNFGYLCEVETELSGVVWCDADLNGEVNGDEIGLAGWEVELIDIDTGEVLQVELTSETGEYTFAGVVAGREYRISVKTQNGFPPVSDPDGLVIIEAGVPVDSSNTAIVFAETDNNGPFKFAYACEVEECAPCDGRVSEITLQLNGASGVVKVVGKHGKDSKTLFEGFVQDGGFFTAYGFDKQGSVGTEIYIYLNGGSKTTIHTSCSVPIGPGMVFGKYEVVEAYSVNGGLICPEDNTPPPPPPSPDCKPCSGRITKLKLQLQGNGGWVYVKGKHGKDTGELYSGYVSGNGMFTVTGFDKHGTLGTEIQIWIDGKAAANIHTSCSVPIGPGDLFGRFLVIEGYSRDGGLLCPGDGGGNPPPPPPPAPDCGPCDGKITKLTLKNNGSGGTIKVTGKDGWKSPVIFCEYVASGATFTVNGFDSKGTLGTEIYISRNGGSATAIHTSCSKPVGPGMEFGPYLVIEGYSKNGGKLCAVSGGGTPPPPPAPDCGVCDGKITKLTLKNNGSGGTIKVTGKDGSKRPVIFCEYVASGATFTVNGFDHQGTLGTEIYISRNGGSSTAIHTSCSKPVGPGMEFGPYLVIEGYSKNGGKLCAVGTGGTPKSSEDCKPKSLSYAKYCAKPTGKKVTVRCKRK